MEAIPDAARIAQTFAEQKRPRVAVPFNSTDFDQFAGVYQGDTVITLSRNGGRFYALRSLGVPSIHMAKHGPTEIFPESENKFFAKDKIAQYSFTRDSLGPRERAGASRGRIGALVQRVDASAARAIADSVAARVRAGKPSPGTQAALDSYIRAMPQDTGAAAVSTGIKAMTELQKRGKGGSPAGQEFRSFAVAQLPGCRPGRHGLI